MTAAIVVYALAAVTVGLLAWLIAADTSTNDIGPIVIGGLVGVLWPLVFVVAIVSMVAGAVQAVRDERRSGR